MAKLRPEDVADIDVKALEAAEYSTEEFDKYYGETPPVGTELNAYVKRMWWTRSAPKAGGGGNDPMLKILTVAAENEGDLAEYNDCPFWLNVTLTENAKFRWGPFFDNFGLSIRAIKARKLDIEDAEDQNGNLINSIDGFKPGEEEDDAWCRIITDQEPYNGVMQPRVKEWLPWDVEAEYSDNGDGEDGDEEADDEYEDEDELEAEAETEAEPEPPARGRGAARSASRSAAPARGSRPARPAPEAAPARRGGRPAAAAAAPAPARGRAARPAAAAAPARRGRGGRGAGGSSEEPPF
jgi:hypothetical protein